MPRVAPFILIRTSDLSRTSFVGCTETVLSNLWYFKPIGCNRLSAEPISFTTIVIGCPACFTTISLMPSQPQALEFPFAAS